MTENQALLAHETVQTTKEHSEKMTTTIQVRNKMINEKENLKKTVMDLEAEKENQEKRHSK